MSGPDLTGQSPNNWPWFKKPENWTGILIPTVVGLGIFALWGVIAPFVAMALQNLLVAGLSLVGIFVLAYVTIIDKSMREAAAMGYKMLMWNITTGLVKMDPLGYLRSKYKQLQEKFETAKRGIGRVSGKRQGLETTIAEKEDRLQKAYREAEVAKRKASEARARGDEMLAGKWDEDYAVLSDEIGMIEKNLADYRNWLEVMKKLEIILDKIRQVCSYSMRTTKNRIDMAEERAEVAKESHAAMLVAMEIIGVGSNDMLAAEAFRTLRDDFEAKMGEITAMTRDAQEVVSKFDLGRAVAMEDLDRKIELMKARAESLMLNGPAQRLTAASRPVVASAATPMMQRGQGYLTINDKK